MKIAITGAAGFVGSLLVEQLAACSWVSQITAYDNLSGGSFDYLFRPFAGKEKVRAAVGDILDSRTLDAALKGADAVVHAAGIVAAADIHTLDQVNCWGTAEVVAAFERSGAAKLVLIGDISVYGDRPQAGEPKLNPVTPYDHSILRAEGHVQRLIAQNRALVVRVGEMVGLAPSRVSTTSVNALVFAALTGQKATVAGNGSLQRNITGTATVVSVVGGYLNSGIAAGTYNVVDYTMTSMQLVATIKELFPEMEVVFLSHHFEGEGLAVPRSVGIPEPFERIEAILDKIKKAF